MQKKILAGIRQNRKGITGLETAIILIAFVVVASVFAYTVFIGWNLLLTEGEGSHLQRAGRSAGLDRAQGKHAGLQRDHSGPGHGC